MCESCHTQGASNLPTIVSNKGSQTWERELSRRLVVLLRFLRSCPLKPWLPTRHSRNGHNGDDVTNVQYKSNRNCHYESPLYNEYFLIKNLLKNRRKKGRDWAAGSESVPVGSLWVLLGPTDLRQDCCYSQELYLHVNWGVPGKVWLWVGGRRRCSGLWGLRSATHIPLSETPASNAHCRVLHLDPWT
jgi:hypothetical protein